MNILKVQIGQSSTGEEAVKWFPQGCTYCKVELFRACGIIIQFDIGEISY